MLRRVLYTGFVQRLSDDSRRLRFLPDIRNADIHRQSLDHMPFVGAI